jgi:hypothetical protein
MTKSRARNGTPFHHSQFSIQHFLDTADGRG